MQFKALAVAFAAVLVSSVAASPVDFSDELSDLLLRRDIEEDAVAILSKRGCNVGERKCVGQVPARCNAHNTWIMGNPCRGNTYCSGGQCIERSPSPSPESGRGRSRSPSRGTSKSPRRG